MKIRAMASWIARALLLACLSLNAVAHETRPAYLEITQLADAHYEVVWKQPTQGELAIHLVPHLANGWLDNPPHDQYAADGFLIRSWRVNAAPDASLDGVVIEIEGLADTLTDAFVNIRLLDGEHVTAILNPQQPSFVIKLQAARQVAVPAYLLLGMEHILTGPDHLLFVLGLLLIALNRRSLLITVSAFTLAHSITLSATLLGGIALPVPFVETLIALSILLLGPEAIRAWRGETSLTLRYPWWVAFAFGLFHGMGFAGGLTSLGFRQDELFATLALFNIGVEIGQLCFIALVLALANALTRALRQFQVPSYRWARVTPAYLVGIGGAYWTLQCGVLWLGVGI